MLDLNYLKEKFRTMFEDMIDPARGPFRNVGGHALRLVRLLTGTDKLHGGAEVRIVRDPDGDGWLILIADEDVWQAMFRSDTRPSVKIESD